MATIIPAKAKLRQVNGNQINFASDTLKCMLVVAGSGAPSVTKTGVQTVADVTAANAEVAGTYVRQTLAGVTVAFDGSSDLTDLSFSNITFAQNAGGFTTARYAIFYKDPGTGDANTTVFAIADLTSARGNVSGDLVLQCPAAGLIQW